MQRIFHHYEKWEDYLNGMYDCLEITEDNKNIDLAITMLSDNNLFLNTCENVLINWPIATEVNLTNKSSNRKAWLGQASCSYHFKVPEMYTRIAWSKLTEQQQIEANNIAEFAIQYFELSYETKN
jgi:hypothetical protein